MEADDRLSAAGLALDLKEVGALRGSSAIGTGRWWESGDRPVAASSLLRGVVSADGSATAANLTGFSLLQIGPKPNRMPPVPESTPSQRVDGFSATFTSLGRELARGERAPGWLSVANRMTEVSIAIPRMLEEYPKEIAVEGSRVSAYIWSPNIEPMSFARYTSEVDREEETAAIENHAQGSAKSTEVVFDFHAPADAGAPERLQYFLSPPVAHAAPAWYGKSGAFGFFAERNSRFPEYRRALDTKFEWMLFNQRWMPWYGMWDYGDWKLYFDGNAWTGGWGNNEPGEDFICWLQFMQTGDPRVFDAARANSRHSMDVDNIHWPADPSTWATPTPRSITSSSNSCRKGRLTLASARGMRRSTGAGR